MGATTYAAMAAHWPGASGPFATPMNEIPKVVFSDSLASADWGETIIAAGDLAEATTRLKQERSSGYLLARGGAQPCSAAEPSPTSLRRTRDRA
jgi:dihydrofolate reductase